MEQKETPEEIFERIYNSRDAKYRQTGIRMDDKYMLKSNVIKAMEEYATQSNQANGGEGFDIEELIRWIKSDKSDTVQVAYLLNQIEYIKYNTSSTPSSKGAFSVEDIRKAFQAGREAYVFEKDMPPVYKNWSDYKATLTPSQSHQPEVGREIQVCELGQLEHNKSIFHLGQCHKCFSKNTIET